MCILEVTQVIQVKHFKSSVCDPLKPRAEDRDSLKTILQVGRGEEGIANETKFKLIPSLPLLREDLVWRSASYLHTVRI